jgi:hypothetical protein
MALTENNQSGAECEAKSQSGICLTQSFTLIGESVIGWINVLGTATIFLLMALVKLLSGNR